MVNGMISSCTLWRSSL